MLTLMFCLDADSLTELLVEADSEAYLDADPLLSCLLMLILL